VGDSHRFRRLTLKTGLATDYTDYHRKKSE